jgi:hypothetical protein
MISAHPYRPTWTPTTERLRIVDDPDRSGVGLITRIGLSYKKAIAFLTSAVPDDMQWLHPDEARSIGIDFDTVPAQPSSEAWSAPSHTKPPVEIVTTPTPQPPPASAAEEGAVKLVRSWYVMWSSMGTDTSKLQVYYGDTIQHYGGTVLKAKVLLEKQNLVIRWLLMFAAKPASNEC